MRVDWEIGYEGSGIEGRIPGSSLEGIVMENYDTTPMSWYANVHFLGNNGSWDNAINKSDSSLLEILNWVEEELKFRASQDDF